MYKGIDDIKRVIDKGSKIEVVKSFIKSYCKGKQYRKWLEEKQNEYNTEYPEYDKNGNVIEYTNEKYTIDDKGNKIENENYKPTFEEWLTEKTEKDPDNYTFKFDESDIDFDEVKPLLKQYAKKLFYESPKKGMLSKNLNIKINAERADLDNMKNLLDYMKVNNLDTIQFRLYDNSFKEITQDQLNTLINELIAFGMELYQKKWQFEQAIDNIKTLEDLEALEW